MPEEADQGATGVMARVDFVVPHPHEGLLALPQSNSVRRYETRALASLDQRLRAMEAASSTVHQDRAELLSNTLHVRGSPR